MTTAPQTGGFSIVRTIGRYTGFHRGRQFGAAYELRPIAAALPAEDLAVLKAQLGPVIASLERDRAAHVDRADRFLKQAIPGVALAALVVGWGITGDILFGLLLGALCAVGVVILPRKLAVLTPLSMFDGAFEPTPYWEPLDADALIPAFSSDLAILNGYINAAFSLPLGDIT